MIQRIKIWHLLLLILLIILVLRFDRIMDIAVLLINYLKLLLGDSDTSPVRLNSQLIDHFISLILLIVIPSVIILNKKKLKYLLLPAGLSVSVFAIIMTLFLFAPVISTTNPDLQFTLSEAKLLPPLSSKEFVLINSDKLNLGDKKFLSDEKLIMGNLFENEFVIGESIEIKSDSIYVYQNGGIKVFPVSIAGANTTEPLIHRQVFLLGSDEYGRDIFSRLVYGTRLSILIGFCSVLLSLLIGVLLGFTAGYYGTFINTVLNRFADMFLSFPVIFLIILIIAFLGSSLLTIIFVLGLAGWTAIFKIVRSEIASLKQKDFIIASKNLGLPDLKILTREMLPLMISPIIVSVVFQFANVIIAEAALSYLGLGLGAVYPSWGAMIHQGQSYLSQAWWISLFPCLFLFVTLLTVNFLGRNLEQKINPQL